MPSAVGKIQSLKSGLGFYGTTNPIVEESIGLKFDLGFFSEMIYNICR